MKKKRNLFRVMAFCLCASLCASLAFSVPVCAESSARDITAVDHDNVPLSTAQNAMASIEFCGVYESALASVSGELQKMYELCVLMENVTNTDADISRMRDQIEEHIGVIHSIYDTTDYEGAPDGARKFMSSAGKKLHIALSCPDSCHNGIDITSMDRLPKKLDRNVSGEDVMDAIQYVSNYRNMFGAIDNALVHVYDVSSNVAFYGPGTDVAFSSAQPHHTPVSLSVPFQNAWNEIDVRIHELYLKAADGTITDDDRWYCQYETDILILAKDIIADLLCDRTARTEYSIDTGMRLETSVWSGKDAPIGYYDNMDWKHSADSKAGDTLYYRIAVYPGMNKNGEMVSNLILSNLFERITPDYSSLKVYQGGNKLVAGKDYRLYTDGYRALPDAQGASTAEEAVRRLIVKNRIQDTFSPYNTFGLIFNNDLIYNLTDVGEIAALQPEPNDFESMLWRTLFCQASVNAYDGLGLIWEIEAALNLVHIMLQRINELMVQMDEFSLDDEGRSMAETEIAALLAEIDWVYDNAFYNGMYFMAKENQKVDIVVSCHEDENYGFTLMSPSRVTDKLKAGFSHADVSEAIAEIADVRAQCGAVQSTLDEVVLFCEAMLNGSSMEDYADAYESVFHSIQGRISELEEFLESLDVPDEVMPYDEETAYRLRAGIETLTHCLDVIRSMPCGDIRELCPTICAGISGMSASALSDGGVSGTVHRVWEPIIVTFSAKLDADAYRPAGDTGAYLLSEIKGVPSLFASNSLASTLGWSNMDADAFDALISAGGDGKLPRFAYATDADIAAMEASGNVDLSNAGAAEAGNAYVIKDRADVYSYGLNIADTDKSGKLLSGSVFEVRKVIEDAASSADWPVMEFVEVFGSMHALDESVYPEGKTYRPAVESDAEDVRLSELPAGFATIVGLDSSSYCVIQKESPKGYNLPDASQTFKVVSFSDFVGRNIYDPLSADSYLSVSDMISKWKKVWSGFCPIQINGTGYDLSELGYQGLCSPGMAMFTKQPDGTYQYGTVLSLQVGPESGQMLSAVNGEYLLGGIRMMNTKGSFLPSTGGAGVYLLYFTGFGLFVLAAAAVLVRKRRHFNYGK